MKPLKYYVAISVDGFIAAPEGSISPFMNQHDGKLAKGEHVDDFLASYAWFDTVLMGRKTYELGLSMGVTKPLPDDAAVRFQPLAGSEPGQECADCLQQCDRDCSNSETGILKCRVALWGCRTRFAPLAGGSHR